MPPRMRTPNELSQQLIPLLLLGIGLVATNNSVTYLDREAASLGAAASPLGTALPQFFSSAGATGRPPLFEILLHFWLRATGGNFDYFRILSVCFFLAGVFLAGRVGRQLAGPSAGAAVVWVGVLWPLGFHYARLATSDSLALFLVAGLTLAYFHCLEQATPGRWAVFLIFAVGLVWTSYFGWAILACLTVDQAIRWRAKEPVATSKAILATVALVCVSFVPLFGPFRATLSRAVNFHQPALSILLGLAFHVFSLLVSESIAAWYWRLSLPAAVAAPACVVLVVAWLPGVPRRLLCYSAALIAVLAVAGALQMKDLFLLAPWILLPAGIAVDAAKPRWGNFALAAALLAVAVTGWYGIYARRYYSALQFVEPWADVASDAAAKVVGGAKVISDQPPFLLYLTHDLRVPKENGPWEFSGLLPETVRHPQVYSPEGWLAAGHPTGGKTLLVRAGNNSGGNQPIDAAARQLDQSCGSISSRLRVRDEGYKWKQRFFPQLHDPQWRIEIREYDCDESNSKQIYRLPSP
ncbi:MAG TPA: hypothetical protein VNZ56_12250 [Verrucomicrobiae bacterium]|jgi:hypothetical protein|nr:hypothetical protein [Verrucomicrobiae bacterium]